MSERWAIAVHGGATEIDADESPAYRRGCERAADAGAAVLAAGGTATDAAVAAVRVLEEDPTFNAGIGSVRRADGRVQCDASLMDGATLDVGAVAGVEDVQHPIELAAHLLRAEQTLLIGAGAEQLAADLGLTGPALHELDEGREKPHDTVGCVALDRAGHVAAALSTGGLPGAPVGRVGDSPLPGAGFYADDEVGAVAFSGTGERIARLTLAAWTIERLRAGDPVAVASAVLERLGRVDGEAGVILLDRDGRVGWAHNSPQFAVAWASDRHPVASFTESAPGGSEQEVGA